jgi:hypothetical protein
LKIAAHAWREPSFEERGNLLILLDYKAIIRSRTKVLKSLSNRPRATKCMDRKGDGWLGREFLALPRTGQSGATTGVRLRRFLEGLPQCWRSGRALRAPRPLWNSRSKRATSLARPRGS